LSAEVFAVLRKLPLLLVPSALVLAVACSNSSSGNPTNTAIAPPPNCTEDDALDCSGGSTGFTCAAGSNPEDEDDSIACSTPVTSGNQDTYCCFTDFGTSDTTCQPDDALQCQSGTVGYSCASGDDPTLADSSLTCSAASGSGGDDDDDGGPSEADFCCATAGSVIGDDDDEDAGAGCSVDGTVSCSSDSTGYACSTGVNPESVDDNLACSSSKANAQGQDIYCCFTGFTGDETTCQPDDDASLGCAAGTYGFSCAADAGSPATLDSSLTQCTPAATPGDYCCVYQ
jgi:hypothetical protein